MITDICAAAVILLTAVRFGRRGFAASVIKALSWVATIILGFMFSSQLADYLAEQTNIDDQISAFILDNFSNELNKYVTAKYSSLKSLSDSAVEAAASSAASQITSVIMTVIAFFLIMIGVSIVAYLISTFFNVGDSGGLISKIDTAGGAAAGVFIGIIYVLIILGLLYACRGVLPEGFSSWLDSSFNSSYFCGSLYADNPLVTIFKAII